MMTAWFCFALASRMRSAQLQHGDCTFPRGPEFFIFTAVGGRDYPGTLRACVTLDDSDDVRITKRVQTTAAAEPY